MNKLKIILISAICWLTVSCSDNKEIKNNITKASEEYISSHFFNAVYLFADQKEILHQGAHGFNSLEKNTHLHADQIMPIASGTKNITAAAILKLAEEKKLAIEEPVAKYLTAQTGVWYNNTVPQWAKVVTLHQLLTHTSGLPEYFMHMQIDITKTHDEINRDIINFIGDRPLQDPKYFYCNTNYVVLGMIIEKLSGQKLSDFFKEKFFEPLGMKNTKLLSLEEAIEVQQNPEKFSYPIRYFVTPNNSKAPNINIASANGFIMVPYADGGLVSTTTDLVKWYKALSAGKIISPESYKLMTTKYYDVTVTHNSHVQEKYVGYGIFITNTASGKVVYGHPGRAVAIRSESGYLPEQGIYYAILSNVMPYIPENLQKQLDAKQEDNKVDILDYLDYILNQL